MQKNLETNNTLFESPKIELLESGNKSGWHHTEGGHTLLTENTLTFTKNSSGAYMAKILPISKLLSNNG